MNPLLQILTNLATTTQRFLPSFQSEQEFEALLFRYGWLVDLEETALGTVTAIENIAAKINEVSDEIKTLLEEEETEEEGKSTEEWIQLVDELAGIVKELYPLIGELKNLSGADLTSLGVLNDADAREQFKTELPERLLEDILVLTIQRHYPIAYGFFHIFGIIEYNEIEAKETEEYRINYTRTDIKWERLGQFISDRPDGLFKEVYSWGGHDFQWEKLLHTLERTFLANRFLARYILPRKSVVERFSGGDFENYEAWVFNEDLHDGQVLHELQIPFIYGTSILDESFYNIGLGIMPTGNDLSKKPNGLIITPVLQGGTTHSFFITPEIALKLEAAVDASDVVGVEIFPDDIHLSADLPDAGISASLIGSPYEPWVIFGDADSHRMEIQGFDLGMSMVEGDEKETKLWFKATSPNPEERGIQVVIDLGGTDSFMRKTSESKEENITLGFDLELLWSSRSGFEFGGGAKLEYEMAINRKLGFLEVTNLYISLEADEEASYTARLRTGIGLRGELGPIRFFVENMGFALDVNTYSSADLSEMTEKGQDLPALGKVGFDLDFAPPKGIGIIVETAAVKGGGYLEFDKPRYIGAAELTISDLFSIKAIAIIDTELPDGKEGYSFLLLITAEFTPIQLGFGFTLMGVGGLIGIHRSMNLEAIRDKVKTDEFDNVLFPEDPIGNIKSIVASLDAIFPVTEGQYAFGIMAKLGWGSPTLIDIKAGLFIQVPKFKIAIIGIVKAEIASKTAGQGEKSEEKVLIRIQLSFAAWYDSDKKLFGFDASLYDSEIIGIKLQGDAAIRVRGGDDPYFMMSVGGFHPEFEPPKGLALGELKRIELSLAPKSIDIYLAGKFYTAITSNTVQLGASIEARYEASSFKIEGEVGFNALFQFSPLYFKIDAWGRVSISIWGYSWGLGIEGSIEGPSPFKFSLSVSFEFGWFSYTKSIPEFTIGKEAEEERPTIDVLEELRVVLDDERIWNPVLPERSELLVALRDARTEFSGPESEADEAEELIFHPIGGIKIDQDRVPLNIAIEKFGHNRPVLHNYFSIQLDTGNESNPTGKTLKQSFAPAQFYEMTTAEKLDRASFEKLDSGIQTSEFEAIAIPTRIIQKEVNYETDYHDPKFESDTSAKPARGKYAMESQAFDNYVLNSSISKSSLGKKSKKRMEEETAPVTTQYDIDDEYVIIHQEGDADFTEIKTVSEMEAQKILDQLIVENPGLEEDLVVVPVFETV